MILGTENFQASAWKIILLICVKICQISLEEKLYTVSSRILVTGYVITETSGYVT